MEIVENEKNLNLVSIEGAICKEPTLRTTLEGNYVASFLIACCKEAEKFDYVPCVALGNDAILVAGLKIGTWVQLDGRFQSRKYIKDNSVNTIKEFVVKELGML